jgi:predicted ArsR family transcriptional regulator
MCFRMSDMDQAPLPARVGAIAVLDQPVRRDLYDLLVGTDGWIGRDEAAAALGVPRSVAAFHLDKLAEAGLADVRFERPAGRSGPGAGRPAKHYRRSDQEVAVSLPDRHYDLAGTVLADALADAATGDEPVEEALAHAARRVGSEVGRDLPDEVEPLEALRRLGYEPRVEGDDIVLVNCPFHRLAERHRPLVCGMNLDLLNGLVDELGAETRLTPRLEPAEGRCCVRLHVDR